MTRQHARRIHSQLALKMLVTFNIFNGRADTSVSITRSSFFVWFCLSSSLCQFSINSNETLQCRSYNLPSKKCMNKKLGGKHIEWYWNLWCGTDPFISGHAINIRRLPRSRQKRSRGTRCLFLEVTMAVGSS